MLEDGIAAIAQRLAHVGVAAEPPPMATRPVHRDGAYFLWEECSPLRWVVRISERDVAALAQAEFDEVDACMQFLQVSRAEIAKAAEHELFFNRKTVTEIGVELLEVYARQQAPIALPKRRRRVHERS
jgi:hypothetical protein